MLYEQRKHDGTLPIIGVNTFLAPADDTGAPAQRLELARATESEKRSQVDRLADFKARHAADAPAALDRLKAAATSGGNVFDALVDAVQHCTLGQISDAFFEVGGQYRRNV
jgi:methylmalonyl-CoA mutase